jgi:5-methylcytosine-specific restriction endonuclease McrA
MVARHLRETERDREQQALERSIREAARRYLPPRRVRRKKARLEAGAVPKGTKDALIRRDGLRCWICEKEAPPGRSVLGWLTIDHLHLVSRGGCNCRGNLRLACGPCNSARGDRVHPAGHPLEECDRG